MGNYVRLIVTRKASGIIELVQPYDLGRDAIQHSLFFFGFERV
ncbi:hypothetical protein C943_02357 [Mariniradius saccharolyticus AK6]|uniref:Uncharacterized protein n=1 Tax=Mariniradius saccharolyticus AK6 TaxID=1239962 RepID=M7X106_9BACT|nr:hypothetical protein C943_02357 [Mariniradius saccharolyticus AK6]